MERVEAVSIAPRTRHYRRDDNFCATVRFADGSVASLVYTALGAAGYPKEQMEIFCDGRVIRLDDYRSLSVSGASEPLLTTPAPDKGLREQWLAFARAIAEGRPAMPVAEQFCATRIALEVQKQLFK